MLASLLDLVAWTLLICAAALFAIAAIGLLRFSDFFCRLHAAAKADTAGMGLLCIGLALKSGSLQAALLLLVIWLVVMGSTSVNCQLLARYSAEHEHDILPPARRAATSRQPHRVDNQGGTLR